MEEIQDGLPTHGVQQKKTGQKDSLGYALYLFHGRCVLRFIRSLTGLGNSQSRIAGGQAKRLGDTYCAASPISATLHTYRE